MGQEDEVFRNKDKHEKEHSMNTRKRPHRKRHIITLNQKDRDEKITTDRDERITTTRKGNRIASDMIKCDEIITTTRQGKGKSSSKKQQVYDESHQGKKERQR